MDLFKVGNIKVSMLHSEKVWTNTKSAIFEHCPGKINGCFLIFKLISSGATLADSLYLPVNLADVVLQKPNITISNQRIVGQKAMVSVIRIHVRQRYACFTCNHLNLTYSLLLNVWHLLLMYTCIQPLVDTSSKSV